MVHGLETIKAINAEAMLKVRSIPNAVFQSTPTNCFRACVATVLGLPISDVPEECDVAKWDWNVFQHWLASRGLQAIEVTFGSGGTIYPVVAPVMCILTGRSPRECITGLHAVVAQLVSFEGFQLLHDPHPSQNWFEGEPTHATFFASLDTKAEVASDRQKLIDAIDLAEDWLQLQQDDYEAMQDAMPSDSDGERELDEIELKCMAAMWTCLAACKKVVSDGKAD